VLDGLLKAASARVTVIHFCTHWYPPSFKMAALMASLSVKYGMGVVVVLAMVVTCVDCVCRHS
jgi:hypothetical protein